MRYCSAHCEALHDRSDTTPAPIVAGTPSYLAPARRAEPNATSAEMPLWLSNRSTCRPPFTSACSVERTTSPASHLQGDCGRRRQMCCNTRNVRPRLEHEQVNHAQCDRAGRFNLHFLDNGLHFLDKRKRASASVISGKRRVKSLPGRL